MTKQPAETVDGRFPPILQGVPYGVHNPEGRSEFVLMCDHAGQALPAEYGTLGLAQSVFDEHVAYDIGAANLARRISDRLDAPAVMARHSRLLIDPNRAPDHPGLIPQSSDGTDIPGNLAVDSVERARRKAAYYDPFHKAVDSLIGRRRAQGLVPAIVGIHSFTPIMQGAGRPWQAGVLWNRDPRLAEPLIAYLRRDSNLAVGDNQPYSGRLLGYSMDHHGGDNGFANMVIEVRQDLIDEPSKAATWGDLLADALIEIEQDRRVFKVEHY